ncbi:MAG: DUF1684 domain-containing protein [Trueperaceae bacterium]
MPDARPNLSTKDPTSTPSGATPDGPPDPATDPTAHAALQAWRDAYVARLTAPDGWWAICGLHWLENGETVAGSAPDAGLPLPVPCPAHAATFHRDGSRVTVVPAGTSSLWSDGAPLSEPVTIEQDGRAFALGPKPDAPRFTVLLRGERRGVRTFDPARASARDPQREVAWYPLEPGWVVPARFEPATDGETVPVVNQLGDVMQTPAAGRLRFRLQGTEHALLATWKGESLFVNLRDAGSGPESYGAGRFLDVAAPDSAAANGATVLDLQRLHHPPCAHTPFATCPLPPLENRLPFVVRAGERTA